MSAPIPFIFDHDEKQTQIRVVQIDGNPWFITADVGDAIDVENIRQTLGTLDDDEKGVCTIYTLGGPQRMGIVSESGLYHLVYLSRKPVGKVFRRWVRKEVLPSIRRTGRYELGLAEPEPDLLAAISGVETRLGARLDRIEGELEDRRKGFSRAALRYVGEGVAKYESCECIYCHDAEVVTDYGEKLNNCREHHADGNRANHGPENLTLPCEKCHKRLHDVNLPDHIPVHIALGIANAFHRKLKQKTAQIRAPNEVSHWDFRAAVQTDMGFPQTAKREPA